MSNPGGIGTAPIAWYKADSLSLSNDDKVSSWTDSSANAYHAVQATGANQPTYKSAGINGQPSINFPNTGAICLVAPILQSQPYTAFVVVKLASTSGSQTMLEGGGTNTGIVGMQSNQWFNYFNGGSGTFSTATPDTNTHVITSEANGASSTIRVDGAGLATGNSGTSGLTALRIGSRADNVNPLNGDIGEVIVFSGLLSSGDRATVEAYLAAKFSGYSATASPTTVPASRTGVKVRLQGSGTSWVSGTTTFSATGATVTATSINNGNQTADLTLTTSTAGSVVITNSTDSTEVTITSVTAFAPDATGVFFTPYRHTVAGASTLWLFRGDGAKLNFTGTSLQVLFDLSLLQGGSIATGNYPYLNYSVNGGAWSRTQLTATGVMTLATGLSDATHNIEIRYEPTNYTDYWTNPTDGVRCIGWVVGSGKTVTTPTGAAASRTKRGLIAGDSITWGSAATNPARQSWAMILGYALDCEFAVEGRPGQGWQQVASDGSPAFPTTFASYYSGQTRATLPDCDYIVVMQGTNDATLTASVVTNWLADARSKVSSNCKIIVVQPFRTQVNSSIASGFNSYVAANPTDTRVYLIDFAARYGNYARIVPDAYHPSDEGHAIYAAMLAQAIQAEVGGEPLTYQWIDENGDDIPGATSETYEWTASTTEDPPRVRVTNATGYSQVFTVNQPIVVT